jgi:hypothetical protein
VIAVELVKTVAGVADGDAYITRGCSSPLTFYYRVTNTGNTELEEIVVTDDNGSPSDPADDFLVGTIPGPVAPSASYTLQTELAVDVIHYNTAWAASTGDGVPVSGSDDALALTWLVADGSDYAGEGRDHPAIWRCESGVWYIHICPYCENIIVSFGQTGDLPAPGDYDGDGTTDVSIYRPATTLWAVRGVTRLYFGGGSEIPVPADYSGGGSTQVALYRQSGGLWTVRGFTRVYFGSGRDVPAPGDYDGSGGARIAVFRGDSGLWAVRDFTRHYFGRAGDYPVPADYDGDGTRETGVFRPAAGLWAIRGFSRIYFGLSGDWPQPADYGGEGTDRVTIYRPSSGLWAVKDLSRVYWGGPSDIPVSW